MRIPSSFAQHNEGFAEVTSIHLELRRTRRKPSLSICSYRERFLIHRRELVPFESLTHDHDRRVPKITIHCSIITIPPSRISEFSNFRPNRKAFPPQTTPRTRSPSSLQPRPSLPRERDEFSVNPPQSSRCFSPQHRSARCHAHFTLFRDCSYRPGRALDAINDRTPDSLTSSFHQPLRSDGVPIKPSSHSGSGSNFTSESRNGPYR